MDLLEDQKLERTLITLEKYGLVDDDREIARLQGNRMKRKLQMEEYQDITNDLTTEFNDITEIWL
jgi:hypothetical protein